MSTTITRSTHGSILPFEWEHKPSEEVLTLDDAVFLDPQECKMRFMGIGLFLHGSADDPQYYSVNIYLPFWVITAPITLLSAWLLLSKRREPPATPKQAES